MNNDQQQEAPHNKWPGLVQGRHVFYEDTCTPPATRAAIVAHVWPGPDGLPTGLVNLCVINQDGTTRPVTSVSFDEASLVASDGPRSTNRWRWMFGNQATALTSQHAL